MSLAEVQERNRQLGLERKGVTIPTEVTREEVVRLSMSAAKTHKKPLLQLAKLIEATGTDPFPWDRLSPQLQKLLMPRGATTVNHRQ